MAILTMNMTVTPTHRVLEQELLKRLERFCESSGLEFPQEAWPKDDRKAYFLLGVCATKDMKILLFTKYSNGSIVGHVDAICLCRTKLSSPRGVDGRPVPSVGPRFTVACLSRTRC